MIKGRYLIFVLTVVTFLSSYAGKAAASEDGVKDVEIAKAAISFSQTEFPRVAYLSIELKNNGDKSIANSNLEINYYDGEGRPIKRSILKNKLTEVIPPGESRKYKIRLKGDVFNERYEEYPYSWHGEVDDFDVKILNVSFARG